MLKSLYYPWWFCGWVISTWTKQTSLFLFVCMWECLQTCVGFFCLFVFYGVLPWMSHWEASLGTGWWGWGERKGLMFLLFGSCLTWKRKLSSSPSDQWKSEDSGKAANRPLLDGSEARWDSSLQSKSLKKRGVTLSSLLKSLFCRYYDSCFETLNCTDSNGAL